jgi:hypothetical protein
VWPSRLLNETHPKPQKQTPKPCKNLNRVAVKAFEPGSVIFQVKNSFPSINTVSFTFF